MPSSPVRVNSSKIRFDYDEEVEISDESPQPGPVVTHPSVRNDKDRIQKFIQEMVEKHKFDSINNVYHNSLPEPNLETLPRLSQDEVDKILLVIDSVSVTEGMELLLTLCLIKRRSTIPALHTLFRLYLNKIKTLHPK